MCDIHNLQWDTSLLIDLVHTIHLLSKHRMLSKHSSINFNFQLLCSVICLVFIMIVCRVRHSSYDSGSDSLRR
jgi:putative effector of murein hydrolase